MPRWMYGRRIATSANASLTASSGARSKHITDFKRTAAVGSAETWTLHVSYAEDSFTGYTAELSVDTAKSAVTQIVIRTANYTLTMTPV